MNIRTKIATAVAAVAIAAVALTGCTDSEYEARKDKQSEALSTSLGIENQKERLSREEDPNAIRYVYILAPLNGEIIGYYTIQGKVSSAGTQLAPEQEIICRFSGDSCQGVDSAKDDGTFGDSDEGFFFFTTEGVLVEMEGPAYIQSDSPIKLYNEAPVLNEN